MCCKQSYLGGGGLGGGGGFGGGGAAMRTIFCSVLCEESPLPVSSVVSSALVATRATTTSIALYVAPSNVLESSFASVPSEVAVCNLLRTADRSRTGALGGGGGGGLQDLEAK